MTIQPGGKDQSVLLATTKTRKQGKPASLLHKTVMKKEFCRMAKAVSNQVLTFYDVAFFVKFRCNLLLIYCLVYVNHMICRLSLKHGEIRDSY